MLRIESAYVAAFESLGLDSVAAVMARFAPRLGGREATVTLQRSMLDLPGRRVLDVFYKQYEYRTPSWRFVGRRSKAHCEFRNYAVFDRLNVPCAERIACGDQRDGLGRLKRAFILTRTIPDALTLSEFWERHCAQRQVAGVRSLRAGLCRQLAELTRRIHDAGFFHNDLFWRNILVTGQPSGGPQLWWIDCPRGRFVHWPPWRWRRRIKDLACLDKSAARFCRAPERGLFLKAYLGTTRLGGAGEQMARRIVAYRRRRWPEDRAGC